MTASDDEDDATTVGTREVSSETNSTSASSNPPSFVSAGVERAATPGHDKEGETSMPPRPEASESGTAETQGSASGSSPTKSEVSIVEVDDDGDDNDLHHEFIANENEESGNKGDVVGGSNVSPPRTVVVQPEPSPYAQLCFDPDKDAMATLVVGRPGDDRDQSVEMLFANSLSMSWESSAAASDAACSTGGSSSASSSSGGAVGGGLDSDPRDVFWIDGSWLLDDGSECSECRRSLLRGDDDDDSSSPSSSSSSGEADDGDASDGGNSVCGKLLRSVSRRRNRYPADRNQRRRRRSSRAVSPKRHLMGRHLGYSVLN